MATLWRQRQEDGKFEDSLGFARRPCLKSNKPGHTSLLPAKEEWKQGLDLLGTESGKWMRQIPSGMHSMVTKDELSQLAMQRAVYQVLPCHGRRWSSERYMAGWGCPAVGV